MDRTVQTLRNNKMKTSYLLLLIFVLHLTDSLSFVRFSRLYCYQYWHEFANHSAARLLFLPLCSFHAHHSLQPALNAARHLRLAVSSIRRFTIIHIYTSLFFFFVSLLRKWSESVYRLKRVTLFVIFVENVDSRQNAKKKNVPQHNQLHTTSTIGHSSNSLAHLHMNQRNVCVCATLLFCDVVAAIAFIALHFFIIYIHLNLNVQIQMVVETTKNHMKMIAWNIRQNTTKCSFVFIYISIFFFFASKPECATEWTLLLIATGLMPALPLQTLFLLFLFIFAYAFLTGV